MVVSLISLFINLQEPGISFKNYLIETSSETIFTVLAIIILNYMLGWPIFCIRQVDTLICLRAANDNLFKPAFLIAISSPAKETIFTLSKLYG